MSKSRTTLVGTPVVAAPGKIFLVGEYAVLEGGVAVLAAVSRYAVAQYIRGARPQSPVVDEAVKGSCAAIGEASTALPSGSVMVDTDSFCQGKAKIGLGSSAATAVATVAAMFETAGVSIEGRQQRSLPSPRRPIKPPREVWARAPTWRPLSMAASSSSRARRGSPVIEPIAVPASLHLVVFWTGESADTRTLVESVRSYSRSAPSSYRMLMGALRTTASAS